MTLAKTGLSTVCRAVADLLRDTFHLAGNKVDVVIGPPAKTLEQATETHCLGLFFYQFEPAGLFPDSAPGDNAWIRVRVLITACAASENGVSAGENDVRLLGEVLRLFHEKPVLSFTTESGQAIDVQVVLQSLSLDDVNRVWTTQKDAVFRPSVAYELALVPVIPSVQLTKPPVVADLDLRIKTGEDHKPAWRDPAPEIAFVVNRELRDVLTFAPGSAEAAAPLQVVIAGRETTPVTLRWETWSAGTGWKDHSSIDATASKAVLDELLSNPTAAQSLQLPFSDKPGQALLYAVRSFRRPTDGATIEVRSNVLLVQLRKPKP